MSERETLADIVADLRGRADCAERHGDRETHNDGVATLLRSIADRIEAIDSADAWRSLYTPDNAAALAAPARNCERFQTGEEAWLAFERENPHWCHDHKSNDPDCTDCEWADCGRCMAEWLFAPAAEVRSERE